MPACCRSHKGLITKTIKDRDSLLLHKKKVQHEVEEGKEKKSFFYL